MQTLLGASYVGEKNDHPKQQSDAEEGEDDRIGGWTRAPRESPAHEHDQSRERQAKWGLAGGAH